MDPGEPGLPEADPRPLSLDLWKELDEFLDDLEIAVRAGMDLGDHIPHFDDDKTHKAFCQLLSLQTKYDIKI